MHLKIFFSGVKKLRVTVYVRDLAGRICLSISIEVVSESLVEWQQHDLNRKREGRR